VLLAHRDLAFVRLLVNAPLAARLELEMFDGVGDVRLCARDAGLLQRAIEQLARRTYEGFTGQVFTVTGLFTDHDYVRGRAAFTENRPSRVLP